MPANRARRLRRSGMLLRRSNDVMPPGPPACDPACARWGDLPHPHIKLEGLDDDTPMLKIECFCSCGAACGGATYDVRLVDRAREVGAPLGAEHSATWVQHCQTHHGFDPETDPEWSRRLSFATPDDDGLS